MSNNSIGSAISSDLARGKPSTMAACIATTTSMRSACWVRRFAMVCLAAGLTFADVPANAQPAPGKHRIAFINLGPAGANAKNLAALKAGFADLGYIEGKNLELVVRWADSQPERLPALVRELVAMNPRIILSTGGPATAKATAAGAPNLPIVFIAGNPVSEQLVTSLARPGGNMTGVAVLASELEAKRLELLKQLVPKVRRVAIILNPSAVAAKDIARDVAVAAKRLNIDLVESQARNAAELDSAFSMIAKSKVDAMVVVSDPVLGFERKRIVEFATEQELPGIYFWREFVEIGGLASYGANLPDIYRRLAFYADKILKGAKPGDLPIEQPTKFEFVINSRTASLLKLTISPELLLRADEVIQ